ncbi:class I SAM-dependent methyltransferase [Paenibacillus sp. FSL R5-0341]|uniref:class I SAM-dependent methyltransferase n=1 Tax=Paenibacillus sp. FSL R5-0341 TaxID=2921636 RepID=UPI0030D11FF8
MGSYWEDRFEMEGRIWGELPSEMAFKAISLYKQFNIKKVLVLGAGYGRNTKELSNFFDVDGIEISSTAIKLAREFDTKSNFIHASIFDIELEERYDAIFCYNLLHLFKQNERDLIINKCIELLNENGVSFFSVFSDEDSNNGKGNQIEPCTYEYKKGKYAHFFTEDDLMEHFKHFTILETGHLKEQLFYTHQSSTWISLRYISTLKK